MMISRSTAFYLVDSESVSIFCNYNPVIPKGLTVGKRKV